MLAGRVTPSAALKALGDWLPLLVFAIGAGFIAAHRTAGSFTFAGVAEQQAKQGPQPLWDDKPPEPAKVMHISPHTLETSEHGGFDREGNLY